MFWIPFIFLESYDEGNNNMLKNKREKGKRKSTQENYSGSPIGTSTPFTPREEIHYVRIFVTSNLTPRPPNNLSNIHKIAPHYL